MAGSDHSLQEGSHARQRLDEPQRGDDPRVLKDVGTIAVEAARIMLEDKVGSLPVVEGGKVAEIVVSYP